MSRPIYEPSLERTDAKLGFSTDQLFRRPAPPAASRGVPWGRRSRGFDAGLQTIGTGTITAVTFNHNYNMGAGESGEDYFAAAAADTIEILQDGVYLISGEVFWDETLDFDWALGYWDAVADQEHMFAGPKTGSTIIASAFTHTHRYLANYGTGDAAFLQLDVLQISGGQRHVTAAYLDVEFIGTWTGDDFTSMDPVQ